MDRPPALVLKKTRAEIIKRENRSRDSENWVLSEWI